MSTTLTSNARWARIAIVLVSVTLAYNVLEAFIALWFGAAADSIALFGFGLDSCIESAAAVVLLHRLWVESRGVEGEQLEIVERRVHRFVGATFFMLALYVMGRAGWALWSRQAAEQSLVGIALAAASLVVMPLVAWGKLRAARGLASAALRAEAKETLACSYLSLTLLLGLTAHATLGWWWADPIAALCMVPWLVKEGWEGLAGDDD